MKDCILQISVKCGLFSVFYTTSLEERDKMNYNSDKENMQCAGFFIK